MLHFYRNKLYELWLGKEAEFGMFYSAYQWKDCKYRIYKNLVYPALHVKRNLSLLLFDFIYGFVNSFLLQYLTIKEIEI